MGGAGKRSPEILTAGGPSPIDSLGPLMLKVHRSNGMELAPESKCRQTAEELYASLPTRGGFVTSLKWGTKRASSFAELLRLIPAGALKSPRRSVVPLVDFCRTPETAWSAIGAAVGLDLANTTEFIFESAVPVQQGVGKSSYSDLLILSPEAAVTIEAKYTEPEYESVHTWLRTEGNNRAEVLAGWLGLINQVVGRTVEQRSVANLPYQLIHRVASACFAARSKRVMAYLIFGASPSKHYAEAVASLNELIGAPPALSMRVLSVPARKLPAFDALESEWNSGQRDLARQVRSALEDGPLFSFGEISTLYPAPS